MKITVEIKDSFGPELEEIMKICGFKDYQEVFNNSLTLLQYVVEQRQSGHKIATVNDDKKVYTTIEMPFMTNINKNKH